MEATSIIRLSKDKDNPFVMVDRAIADDSSLSFAARGMMLYLLSKPDNWTVRMGDLANSSQSEGMQAVRSIFKELEISRYVTREKTRSADGRWAWETTVHESPTIYGLTAHGSTTHGQPAHILSTNRSKKRREDAKNASSQAKPAGVPKVKRKLSPEQQEHNAQKKAIQEYFEQRTNLKIPRRGTSASIGKLWWNPVREICELADWNLDAAKKLVNQALAKLEDMTVSDPNSILKTARAIAAKQGRARASPGVTIAPGVLKLPVG